MGIGVKWRSTDSMIGSLNIDEVSRGVGQATATGNLAPESQLYTLFC